MRFKYNNSNEFAVTICYGITCYSFKKGNKVFQSTKQIGIRRMLIIIELAKGGNQAVISETFCTFAA